MTQKKLAHIYCHPIKGLRPQSLTSARLVAGRGLEWDRNFAFKHVSPGEEIADVRSHAWLSKRLLLNQHDYPELAQIEPHWNPKTKILQLIKKNQVLVAGDISTQSGRTDIEKALLNFVKSSPAFAKAYHPELDQLALLGDEKDGNTFYADSSKGPVSIAFVESFLDLEQKWQCKVDPRSFRINLHLSGAPAWGELEWPGKKIRIGNVTLLVTKPIGRCPNIDVHPESGLRHTQLMESYKDKMGHSLMGIRSEILNPGPIAIGDPWELV